jgi:predicted Zn-dependent peptidase
MLTPPTPNRGKQVKLVDRPGAHQSTVRLGLAVIDPTQPDFMALSVANTLLGGSLTSRITMNLREEKGWTYSPSSSLSTHYRSGIWLEGADITTPETGPAIKEIYKEIERLQKAGVNGEELRHVQDYRNGLFVLANGTRQGLLGQLAFMDVHGLPFDWLSSFVQRLYAVTPAEVTAATRKYLDVNRMSLAVVGDLKVIQPQLESVQSHGHQAGPKSTTKKHRSSPVP